MIEKIDLIDRRILSELDWNARATLTQLAKKIKKSKQLVSYRIKNLERTGLIKGYNAIIDYSKLGYISFRVYINLKTIISKKQIEFIEFLKKQKGIWWLMLVENICDVAYAIQVQNIYEFYDHLNKLSKYNRYIKSKQVVIYSHIKQYPKSYILEEKRHDESIIIGASNKEKIDEIDLKLLRIISDNARISLVEISLKLGIKPQSIIYRMKNLEKKKIVKGYRANINIDLFGFKNYKIYLKLTNNLSVREIETFCYNNPFVINTNKTIGGADFEIELQLRDLNQLHKILDKLKDEFSAVIDDYEYGVARKEIKMVYLPL